MSDPTRPLRLNLGCGNDILPGFVNHDWSRRRPEVEVAHDLQSLPWPWDDDVAEEVRLFDVIEHLPEVVPVIDECWRVLGPSGVLHLRVPHYQHPNAWIDPTHRRPFHLDSFDYFDPDTFWGTKYGFYTTKKWKLADKEIDADGNVVVVMRTRKDKASDLSRWKPYTALERMLEDLVPPASRVLLVGGERPSADAFFDRNETIPFLEHDGEYWGKPPDDDTAIAELERMRRAGAGFIVFGPGTFWWLGYYAGLNSTLRSRARCVLENDRLILFDLRPVST
jgi:SAM-dependent methyltransferase